MWMYNATRLVWWGMCVRWFVGVEGRGICDQMHVRKRSVAVRMGNGQGASLVFSGCMAGWLREEVYNAEYEHLPGSGGVKSSLKEPFQPAVSSTIWRMTRSGPREADHQFESNGSERENLNAWTSEVYTRHHDLPFPLSFFSSPLF